MDNGVTIIDPKSTYIGDEVEIGRDTVIYPNNVIEGTTKIGEGVILYPNSRITNSEIDDFVEIQSSVILDSKIGKGTNRAICLHKTRIYNWSSKLAIVEIKI